VDGFFLTTGDHQPSILEQTEIASPEPTITSKQLLRGALVAIVAARHAWPADFDCSRFTLYEQAAVLADNANGMGISGPIEQHKWGSFGQAIDVEVTVASDHWTAFGQTITDDERVWTQTERLKRSDESSAESG